MKQQMRKMNCLAYCNLIKLLMEGTRSCKELAEETGLHVLTVYQYTREFHKAGLAHIVAWEPDTRGRSITKVYMWGEGKDAKRQKIPSTQRSAAYRAKKKQLELMERMAA